MWHFCRKSSDRTAEKSQEQTLQSGCEDGHFVGRVPTGFQRSHENRLQSDREDGTFVGRVPTGRQRNHKNRVQSHCCSLMAKMALLSEEFRQDGREVTRTDCSQVVHLAILSKEVWAVTL